MRTTNWDDYRFFLAIAESGTITGAAKNLGVNYTTAHRRMKSLEERLNTELFSLEKNKYHLTPLGETIFDITRNIEKLHIVLDQSITAIDTDGALHRQP